MQDRTREWIDHLLFPSHQRNPVLRYGFALATVLLAFAIRRALEPLLFDHSPLLLFILPVTITAIAAGKGPALVGTVLSCLLGVYFFPPLGVFGVYPEHVRIGIYQTAVFLATCLVITKLGDLVRSHRWRAETSLEQLRQTLGERDTALERIRVLTGLLPICAGCKSIRDESGNWRPLETYISAHSGAQFSHGMCPDCFQKWYGNYLPESGPVREDIKK